MDILPFTGKNLCLPLQQNSPHKSSMCFKTLYFSAHNNVEITNPVPSRRRCLGLFDFNNNKFSSIVCPEKGRGDKCCPGPESCLSCVKPVLGASVSEWHIRLWDGCHGAQRQGGVYLCQAPGGMVARGSGCAHRFSPKLGNPGIASVWDWRVVASNTYPQNRLLRKTTTKMVLQELLRF